jgi:hypothetical protein
MRGFFRKLLQYLVIPLWNCAFAKKMGSTLEGSCPSGEAWLDGVDGSVDAVGEETAH